MRLRITLALIGLLALALLFAGSASLLLVRHAQSSDAQQTLLRQVRALVKASQDGSATDRSFPVFKRVAGFSDESVSVIYPNGTISPQAPAVPDSLINTRQLRNGHAIVVVHDNIVLAAARLIALPDSDLILVIEAPLNFSTDNIWFFLTAGGVTLLVVVAAASAFIQRISRRVDAVVRTVRQIASGDLASRVEDLDQDIFPELRELDRSINTMAANLERSQHTERDFLVSISHEFRTPLTSVLGYSSAIIEHVVEDPVSAAMVINAQAERLEHLIRDLLDLARLRSSQFPLDLSEVDIVSVTGQSVEAFRYAFVDAGLELRTALGNGSILVSADPHRLGQVVGNLIENALKFAHHCVEVTLEVTEETVVIFVRDDGSGISGEDLPLVFERLFRSDHHIGTTLSSGLGLAIVAELVAAMGGSATARSPVNAEGGTEFAVYFPRSNDD